MKVTLQAVKDVIEEVLSGNIDIDDAYFNGLMKESHDIVGHPQPYYSVFYALADMYSPAFCVELGSWRAFAAAGFALGNPKGKVVTIDIHREDKVAQQRCIQIARDIPNLTYINAWTWDAVRDVERVGLPIDILYIDAWHEYQYAQKEWELYSPLLADNALVICDDVFDSAGTTELMEKFFNELPGSKFTNVAIHPGVPMGFLKYTSGISKSYKNFKMVQDGLK